MAKKTVVEIQCDRCPRREYIDGDAASQLGTTTVTFEGKSIVFADLCSACRKAVAAHVEGIARKLEGKSPERVAKTKKPAPEGAGPVVPPEKPPVELIKPVPPPAARAAR